MLEKIIRSRLVLYFIVASLIVIGELAFFQLLYLLFDHYILATVFSFILGVLANWIFCRKIVFNFSRFSPIKELMLILGASLVGLGIQLVIVVIAVEKAHLVPIIGKSLSIASSFLWNYWVRAYYIFAKK